jgi:hypothetical protein
LALAAYAVGNAFDHPIDISLAPADTRTTFLTDVGEHEQKSRALASQSHFSGRHLVFRS